MVGSIKGIAFKFIKSNKFIFISSIFSIMISISLIINMFMFTSNAEQSLKNEIKELYGEMDLLVEYDVNLNKKFDKQTINKIDSLKNIEELSRVMVGQLEVGNEEKFEVYSVGVDNTKLSKSRYKYKKDISDSEVVLNKGLAEGLGVGIGDEITINSKYFKIVEMFDDIKQSSVIPNIIFININTFKDMTNNDNEATHVMIDAVDESRNIELVRELKNIDKDFSIDLLEEDQFIKGNISSLKGFMVVLSVLVIIMCSLFILSNFQTFLYNYRSQFALIRSIGGSSKQAFMIVLIQCTFINFVGVIFAIIVSYLSSQYLISFLSSKFLFEVAKIEFSFNIAVIVAICSFFAIEIFMLFPALKSSKILPLKIVEENEKIEQNNKLGKIIGLAGIVLSIVLFIFGVVTAKTEANSAFAGIISSIFLVLGTYKLFPYFVKNILNKLLPVFKFIGGNGAVVAIKNLIPQVRKSTIIIMALSTMIMIAVFGGAVFKTILVSNEDYLKSQFALDIVITDRDTTNSELGGAFKNEIDSLEGVENSAIISTNGKMYLKVEAGLEYVEFCFTNLNDLIDEKVIPDIQGNLKSNIVITKDFAKRYSLNIGDSIKIKKTSTDGKSISEIDTNSGFDTLRVGAIIDNFSVRPGAMIILDWSNEKYVDEFTVFYKGLIASNNIDRTLGELENLKRQYPQIKWTTLNQALEESKQVLYQRWTLFIMVVVTILCSLVLGIFNMLINNILTKRKEYAILRTLNLNKKGLIKVILTQVIIYVFLGVILGCILGTIISNIVTLTESFSFSHLDYRLMLGIVGFLIFITLVVFIPFAVSLSNRKIAEEIKFETK